MSDTRNVKLGVCRITWGGVDLGYTKGGVEVEVASETHKVTVDQFGSSEINEYIMARSVSVTAPLAETTVENLQRIMPGSTLVISGGAAAAGAINFAGNPTEGETVTVNGVTFTFTEVPADEHDVEIGETIVDTLAAFVASLSDSDNPALTQASYSISGNAIAVTHTELGTIGNAFTLDASGENVSVSGPTLVGGIDAKKRADVTNGIGISLLALAKELVLHPIALPDDDRSEDFIIPLAGTAGAANFAYKLDEERIFNVVFTAYPDPVTKVLFKVGDPTA